MSRRLALVAVALMLAQPAAAQPALPGLAGAEAGAAPIASPLSPAGAPAQAPVPAAAPAPAPQPPSAALPNIADLRADLDAVAADLQGLRAALRVSGAAGYAGAGGPDAIARMDAMEATLRRLTGAVEQARNHIEAVTRDSAARLDEVEFRLCQLEEGCDLGALADGDGLGGPLDLDLSAGTVAAAAVAPAAPVTPASAAEQAAFAAALALAQAGDPAAAAAAFAAVARDHAGGPLFAEARFFEGRAQQALGDHRAAARAFTDVFAADPAGPRAPEALLAVARIMAEDGQPRPACQFLGEVILRHADSTAAADATQLYDRLSCDAELDLAPEP